MSGTGWHVPLPSQRLAPRTVRPEQVAAAQIVVAEY
jgi:hypothetical protein